MAVRPPQDGIDDGSETVAFGIAALDSYLDETGIEFPTDEKTLRSSLGDTEIPYDAAGNTVTFDTAMDSVPQERFETEQELLNALYPVFEEHRKTGGNSILARIRSFIPV